MSRHVNSEPERYATVDSRESQEPVAFNRQMLLRQQCCGSHGSYDPLCGACRSALDKFLTAESERQSNESS